MSAHPNDGGPAFPAYINGVYTGGMSLRDYFAAKAMQACVADPNWRRGQEAVTAETAYLVADAMLRAREVTP